MAIKLIKACKELNLSMSTIVHFLQENGHEISVDPNVRISDEEYIQVAKEYNRDMYLKLTAEKQTQQRETSEARVNTADIFPQEHINIEVKPSSTQELHPKEESLFPSKKNIRNKNNMEENKVNNFQSSKPCEICFQFHEKLSSKWNARETRTIDFERLCELLLSKKRICYFQRQSSEDSGVTRYKITIPFSESQCAEFKVGLKIKPIGLNLQFYFFVAKAREVAIPPRTDAISAICDIRIADVGNGILVAPDFQKLINEVDKLNLPRVDVNVERDKQIWHKYVEAMRALVSQKEQIWKIKKIGEPYYVTTADSEDEHTNIEIEIQEKDLCKQFDQLLKDTYERENLIESDVTENNGWIEFEGEHEFSTGEREKLEEIAREHFYTISEQSPTHLMPGEIRFKYDQDSITETIIPDIINVLANEYELDIKILDNGLIQAPEKYIKHIAKIVSDKYSSIVEIIKDSTVKHAVKYVQKKKYEYNYDAIFEILQNLGIERNRVHVRYKGNLLVIEASASLQRDVFKPLGLIYLLQENSYYSRTVRDLKPIEGMNIEGHSYYVSNVFSSQANTEIINKINSVMGANDFRRGMTRYTFQIYDEELKDLLCDFKTNVETIPGTIQFNVASSVLFIKADSSTEHQEIVTQIKKNNPDFNIADVEYSPSYYIKAKGDSYAYRKETILAIQNLLRERGYDGIQLESIKKYERNLFSYKYDDEEQRLKFVADLQSIVEPYSSSIDVEYENELGITRYDFIKNERLELDNASRLEGGIRQASFKFYTQNEYNEFKKVKEQYGEYASFNKGINIGTLVKKAKGVFTFRINPEFLSLYDTVGGLELSSGYIQPFFPGERTNISRMLHAMRKVSEPDKNEFLANNNITNFLFDASLSRQPIDDFDVAQKNILANLNEPMLCHQAKQLEAVTKAMIAQDIAIIQGPPGTGKTTVIAEIIWQTLRQDPSSTILITSQTNLAVDNVLERLKGKRLVRPIRIGNLDKFEDEGKVYSDERLDAWPYARVGSVEEDLLSNNAIHSWIQSVEKRCVEVEQYAEPLRKWKDNLSKCSKTIKERFGSEYMKNINVFAATCSECGSRRFSELFNTLFVADENANNEPIFDLVIMDEASKATPPELVLPLTLGRKVVVIGDHKQLPPMIDENDFSTALESIGARKLVEEWTSKDYKISQFEKLFDHAPEYAVASLDTQFRMHEQIMDCISQFYEDQKELANGLICGIKDVMDIPDLSISASRWHGLNLPPLITPESHAIWINVSTPEIECNNSYKNMGEVEAIEKVLHALTKAEGFSKFISSFTQEEDKEIGIITYYMSQKNAIQNALYPNMSKSQRRQFERFKCDNEYNLPFRINTVDRFQGMERNIIIVSTVRSHQTIDEKGNIKPNTQYPQALGFTKEFPRINVGFSRAKRLLIVIGNQKHFAHKLEYQKAMTHMQCIDITQLENL